MNKMIRIIALISIAASLCGCAKSFDELDPVVEATNIQTETELVEATTVETESEVEDTSDETESTVPEETEVTEVVEEVRWEVPGETYVIDISREAQTDLERMAWAIYLEGGGDAVCDDCRRRIADVILNRVECRITNMDYYWEDTLIGVLSDGGINPYQNMGNRCIYPLTAYEDYERHAVERAYRIAHEVLRGQHSEIYRKGYFYYAGANVYGWEPETAINCCGMYFMRQRGWDNSKFEQDWVLKFD
jgi:hypothetical protein